MAKKKFLTVEELNAIIAHLPRNILGVNGELKATPFDDGSYELEYPDNVQKMIDKVDSDNPPPEPVPHEVNLLNLRVVAKTDVRGDKTTFEVIEQGIAGIATPNDKVLAEEVWARSSVIDRDSPVLATIAKSAKLKEKEVDELFRKARKLVI